MSGAEGHSYDRDDVIKIINTVIEKAQNASAGKNADGFFEELKGLRDIIEGTRQELRQGAANDISNKHIPTATDELDAIVEATEIATGSIMDACENLQSFGASVDDSTVSEKIEEEVVKIFEACTFQDITGQRISKVVSSLKQIEDKVEALLAVLGIQAAPQSAQPDEDTADVNDDASLLNGPQMADEAISQDDIDKLLADFD